MTARPPRTPPAGPQQMSGEMMDVQAREVIWYRLHGRHPERIRLDSAKRPYVIGDWSWRRLHPTNPELVEDRMRAAGLYYEPKPKRCGACGVTKPPEEFYIKRNGRPMWQCKACSKARAIKWQREHPKRLRLVS